MYNTCASKFFILRRPHTNTHTHTHRHKRYDCHCEEATNVKTRRILSNISSGSPQLTANDCSFCIGPRPINSEDPLSNLRRFVRPGVSLREYSMQSMYSVTTSPLIFNPMLVHCRTKLGTANLTKTWEVSDRL